MGDSASSEVRDVGLQPASVDRIIISGLNRTDEGLIKKQLVDLAKSTNLNELFQNVVHTKEKLNKLGVFRSVFAVVDVADANVNSSKYKVTFKVQEKKPLTARLSATTATDGTNQMCGTIRLNNILHRAEFADLDLEFGSNHLTAKCATLSKPLENNPYIRFSVGGTEGHWDHWWAKFLRSERSVFSEIQAETDFGIHKFQWEAAWREIAAKDNSTPWVVRKESGPAVKVGLRHTFERDSRSDRVFPETGSLFRFTEELATITPGSPSGYYPNQGDRSPGNIANIADDKSFQLKLEGVVNKPFRIFDWLVGELSFSSGMTHSLTRHPITIIDRYFLGGPLELRGFQWRSVSPVEPLVQPGYVSLPVVDPTGGDSAEPAPAVATSPIGAEAYWLTGAHLYTPLPYFGAEEGTFASHFRIHGFSVTGSTLDSPVQKINNCFYSPGASPGLSAVGKRLAAELVGQPRTVVGIGLVIRFAGLVRMEINYCIPVLSQPGDSLKTGFSFGFGFYYM
ncbi:unnamed protein product [Calicophoron daubneyi]|uniref:Bacterial surface antigen (D15) domain-containing protein n=1 Tax=Calicophoron daubneyi TaxID=300641 RepID=A0AAV2SWI4_CALDB